jgi:hypothetical protein
LVSNLKVNTVRELLAGKSASCRKSERAFGRQAENFGRVGSLDTGDRRFDNEKRQGPCAVGSSRKRSKAEVIPKGNARVEEEKPEESEIQEGRGARVI